MGFLPSATTAVVTAKLTPFGRQQLLANNNVISHFSLGDSDANYRAKDQLLSNIPNISGNIGLDSSIGNSLPSGTKIRNKIIVNVKGDLVKPIESKSLEVLLSSSNIGITAITGSTNVVDRTQTSTNPLTNLFTSFGLPITDANKALYTNVNDNAGGFANTALSGFNQDKILIVGIDSEKYGEMLDGRKIKVNLTTSGGSYTLYSTYQKSLTKLVVQDGKTSEVSLKSAIIGDNIAFLFSDEIQKPNNDSTKSWGTGYATTRPFSENGKELFNLVANTPQGVNVDKACGIAYLDKGFIVITEPSIVNTFNANVVTVEYDSLSTEVAQNINCFINRGEFINSTNSTFNVGDQIRVSEIGIHDTMGNLVAIAKTNKHIVVGANQFMMISIKITV